jgi:hypothetical protein
MVITFILVMYILCAKFFVDWTRWEEFYPTILYFITCNFAYNFIFYQHTLWMYNFKAVDWLNHTFIELAFSLIIMPVFIMFFLQYFPKERRKFFYVAIWVVSFSILEYFSKETELFIHDNEWGILWSTVFNLIMFILLRIHYRKPLLALLLSVPTIIILLFFFHPSFTDLK